MSTPWQQFVSSGEVKPDDIPRSAKTNKPSWGWRAQLPSWVWHQISIDRYPGWDRVGDAPPFVMLEHTDSAESREMAVNWDYEATGLYYYRDWTGGGSPFVAPGEMYWSGFWFEKIEDAIAFHKTNGGTASWQPDFDEKQKAMQDRRMGR